jgi:hypothetical protein
MTEDVGNCDDAGDSRSLERRQFVAGAAAFVGLAPFIRRVEIRRSRWRGVLRLAKDNAAGNALVLDHSQMLQMGLFMCQRDGAGTSKRCITLSKMPGKSCEKLITG